MKWFLMVAVVFGTSALMLDAYFAHGLADANLDDHALHALHTASRYQLMSSMMLIILVLLYRSMPSGWIIISQLLQMSGVVFFCASIYARYLLGITMVAGLGPVGGISFMLSFLALLPLMLWL